jgi:nucleoside-diphosphate-sugar epimerase
MAQSFSARDARPLAAADDSRRRRKVLVTGAAGNIGSYFAQHSKDKYDLRLMIKGDEDRRDIDSILQCGDVVTADVSKLDDMKRVCAGIDTVVHLAADPSPNATWDSVLNVNITGTYNTLVAAKACGCRRVVYASSIHAVSGYSADYQVHTNDPVNPGDLYGVSKCFGEALARYMAEQEGLSAICLRIGAFQPIEAARDEGSIGMLDAWISHRDLHQLIEKSIDVAELKFGIFHGLSDNRFKRLDISDARELLGYAPQDDLTQENPKLKELRLREQVPAHNVQDARQKSGLRNDLNGSLSPAKSS